MVLTGICNFCGRHAHKHQRIWSHIVIGVTTLNAHKECAERYDRQRLHPRALAYPQTEGARLTALNNWDNKIEFGASWSDSDPPGRYRELDFH